MKSRFVSILFLLFIILCFSGCPNGVEESPVSTPVNLKVQEVFSDGVSLTWDGSNSNNSYVIYISTSDNISSASSLGVNAARGVRIIGLNSFTQYYFWVQAVSYSNRSDVSDMVTAKTLIGAPKKVELEIDGSDLKLTWDSVPNATEYLILYANKNSNENAPKIKVPSSSSNMMSYTLSQKAVNDGLYYVWVYGVNDEKPSSYGVGAFKRKGIPNYKFHIESAPVNPTSDYSLQEVPDDTEVFMLKINNSSKNVIANNKTGTISNISSNTMAVSKDIYPVYNVVGSRISRDTEVITPLQDESSVIRHEHKLSKEFNYNPQKFVKVAQSRNESSIQNFSSYYANEYQIGDKKQFWVDDEHSRFTKKDATLVVEGDYCYVWVLDKNYDISSESKVDNKITFEQANAVSEKFDALYEKETTLYGDTYKTAYQNDDINSDGLISPEEKISILILDIFDDASSVQSSGVLGYFWAKDFYPDSSTSKSGIRSNETEIFYIDSHFLDSFTEMTYSTLAHEFQHMLNFVNKNLKWEVFPSTWYNEMLSMVCEDLLQDDIGIEDKDSPRSRLAQFNYGYLFNGANEWFNDSNTLYSYAHAYAFGAFITRNYGGADLVKAMMENKSVDFESILDAINEINDCYLTKGDLLKEFARALCYPEEITGAEDDENSLLGKAAKEDLKHFYRGNSCTIDGFEYKLRPICLADYYFRYYDENNNVQYKYSPYYLEADQTRDLRPLGVSVHTFGIQSDEVTFDYKAPTSSDVNVYFVIQ